MIQWADEVAGEVFAGDGRECGTQMQHGCGADTQFEIASHCTGQPGRLGCVNAFHCSANSAVLAGVDADDVHSSMGTQRPDITRREGTLVGHQGDFGPSTQCIGIFFDDPRDTPQEKLRAKACVSVPDSFTTDDPDIEITEVPAGEYGKVMHEGPYERLGDTYAWVHDEWLPKSGREFDDRPCFEIYLNDPSRVAPEKVKTVLRQPVRAE